jgi:hypothetical protein
LNFCLALSLASVAFNPSGRLAAETPRDAVFRLNALTSACQRSRGRPPCRYPPPWVWSFRCERARLHWRISAQEMNLPLLAVCLQLKTHATGSLPCLRLSLGGLLISVSVITTIVTNGIDGPAIAVRGIVRCGPTARDLCSDTAGLTAQSRLRGLPKFEAARGMRFRAHFPGQM